MIVLLLVGCEAAPAAPAKGEYLMKRLYRILCLVLLTAACLLLAACTAGPTEPATVSPTQPADSQPTVATEAADDEATEPAAEATAIAASTTAATTEPAAVAPTEPGDSQSTLPTEPADAEATEPAAEPVAEPTALPTPTAIPTPRVAVTITGEAVAYAQDSNLFIRALDGDEAIAVETCPEGLYCELHYYLKWSPDGQRLLYNLGGSLRLADRQGNVQIVSDDIASSQPGAWSPDGRAIAFFRPTNTYIQGSETEPDAEVHEVWTAAVPSEDLGAGSADGAVGALQLVGHVHIYTGCGGCCLSQSQVLYVNEGGFYGYMAVIDWTASGILLYTNSCLNVGIGRFDMNSGTELEPFDIPLRGLALNNTGDRWYAVTGPTWPPEPADNQLVTGTPDSLAVEIIPTSQPVELVFYGPVSGRLYYTTRELVERAVLGDPGYEQYFPFYRSALWTINADGTGETLLWQAEDHAFARLTERPDGRILFTRVENERELYQAAQDANITDLAPYAPQRHIVQMPAIGGEPAVVIANAGQPSTTMVPPSGSCMNDSVFVLDVNVPDGTHIASGVSFTKTWRLRNSGTCAWDASYRFNFVSGERMDGPESMAIGQTVLPGEEVDISVALTAPQADGTYRGQWQLVAPDGTAFGAKPYVEIVTP
jgi:hypothetical protein